MSPRTPQPGVPIPQRLLVAGGPFGAGLSCTEPARGFGPNGVHPMTQQDSAPLAGGSRSRVSPSATAMLTLLRLPC